MAVHKGNTCSFVVKVWVEEIDDATDNRFWRGHITHVFTGKRQYFENLTTMTGFISHYLEELGNSVDQPNHPTIDSF